ncbi:hypothetical protein BDV35DRAFT_381856 [Aspergillus flavus]|uniref:Rhodopsin domain-containing protein n=1 Tax=Aspergillus flavus TaxID=5059 RepID=A0A5N6GX13_ASPFL|nr:hypothetical protein BDV35DRAFT_381856 [Aspergillus flavus]
MAEVWERSLSPERIAYLAQSRIPEIIFCNTALLAIATAGLLVRLFVRIRYLTGINLDDLLCLTSWFNSSVTKYGFGKHIGTVQDFGDRAMFLKLDFVTMLSYVLALGAIKISFCLLYLHIFPGKKFRMACWWLLAILVAETIEEVLVVIFQCWPVHKAWDATGLVEGKCVDMTLFYYANFGIKLATDVALFAMPIPKVLRLKMEVGKRVGLVMMFSLGLLVCVTSIIRVTYFNPFSVDHTWVLVDAMNWSCVEVAVAIFIACIPSFKTFISYRSPTLQRLLGFASKDDFTSPSKMYGSSTRRTRADVEASHNGSQERIIHAGIQVTTDYHYYYYVHPQRTHVTLRPTTTYYD